MDRYTYKISYPFRKLSEVEKYFFRSGQNITTCYAFILYPVLVIFNCVTSITLVELHSKLLKFVSILGNLSYILTSVVCRNRQQIVLKLSTYVFQMHSLRFWMPHWLRCSFVTDRNLLLQR